jgi:hypothetical protein
VRRRPRIASGRELLAAGSIDVVAAVTVYVLGIAAARRLGLSLEPEGKRDLDPLPEPDRDDPDAFVAAFRERRRALRGRPLRLVRRDGTPLPHDRTLLVAARALLVALVMLADLRRPSPLPGRRLLGLEIARADGRPLRPRDSLVRQAVGEAVAAAARRAGGGRASASLGKTALLLAVQLRDPEHRSLGGRIAGTRTVVRPRRPGPRRGGALRRARSGAASRRPAGGRSRRR